jgi:hypothetical protein
MEIPHQCKQLVYIVCLKKWRCIDDDYYFTIAQPLRLTKESLGSVSFKTKAYK